jgi:hypothetical protein
MPARKHSFSRPIGWVRLISTTSDAGRPASVVGKALHKAGLILIGYIVGTATGVAIFGLCFNAKDN